MSANAPRRPPDPAGHDEPPAARSGGLRYLVEQEARRVLSEAQIRPDPARVAAGWQRRFIADQPRAEEALELYGQMGYEVCADPVRREQVDTTCDACVLRTLLQLKTIYTRRRQT